MPAKRTLQDAELCFTQINDLKQMLSGVLNIGISYTFAPVLMEAVKDFTRQYPGVRLNIICRTMEELLELLPHKWKLQHPESALTKQAEEAGNRC